VLRLGSLLLTGVLLGVPRALEGRAFGARRPVYVEVSPWAPELLGLAQEIERALAAASFTLAARRSEAVTVVEVTGVAHSTDRGRPVEAFTLDVREGGRARRVILQGPRGRRADAARLLLERLAPTPES